MNRRKFIRLLGGGIAVAAAAPLAGCSDLGGMPDSAISAWAGPPADEADPRRWALGYAILAPNPHNRQPWLVDLSRADELAVYIDTTRLLPETDPFDRQILIGTGAFLELLVIPLRARGYSVDITLFPQGEPDRRVDSRPIAHLRVARGDSRVDPLFGQILKRHTNRGLYRISEPIPAAAVGQLKWATASMPVHFGLTAEPTATARLRELATEAYRIELTTPRTMLESLQLMRVGASEIDRHRDGISITAPMVVVAERLGLFDRSKAPAADSTVIRDEMKRFDTALASTPAFAWLTTADNSRPAQIAAGRAYVRMQLAGTGLGISMQPLSQALQEYPEMRRSYETAHRLLPGEAAGHTVQMFCRVGRAEPAPPAPRRGVQAQLRT